MGNGMGLVVCGHRPVDEWGAPTNRSALVLGLCYTTRMQIKGAIFDQDGLLFDTEILFQRAWIQAGTEMGVAVPAAMTRALCGCGRDALPAVIGRFLPELDVSAYVDRAISLAFNAQMTMTPVLKPGVREMLACCREKGVRTAIATSSMLHLVEHNLASTGLVGAFDAIVTGSDVEHGKPEPDIFLLAAAKLGLAPADCLVFEDAFTGIRAAHAAGCRPVLIPDRLEPTAEILELCICRSSLLEARDVMDF